MIVLNLVEQISSAAATILFQIIATAVVVKVIARIIMVILYSIRSITRIVLIKM